MMIKSRKGERSSTQNGSMMRAGRQKVTGFLFRWWEPFFGWETIGEAKPFNLLSNIDRAAFLQAVLILAAASDFNSRIAASGILNFCTLPVTAPPKHVFINQCIG